MKELNELIEVLDSACSCLTSSKIRDFAEYSTLIINKCFSLFPRIIVAYSNESMSDLLDDAMYWPAQLERVINVLNNKDLFAIFDVLYNETRSNLIYVKNVYEERGIEI